MRLSIEGIKDKEYVDKKYLLPKYDILKVKEETLKNPKWVHFGAGNIFRAYIAKLQQRLLNENYADTGIIVVEGYDYKIIDKVFTPYNNLSLAVTLKNNKEIEKEVIASVVESLKLDKSFSNDFKLIEEIFENPTLQVASFTITEKGYELKDNNKNYYSSVVEDFSNGLVNPKSYLGKVLYLLYKRYLKGNYKITLVSMDNCSNNGLKLKNALFDLASNYLNNNLVTNDFLDYLNNNVSYPCTMIDKITPRPDLNVSKLLLEDNFLDQDIFITNKNTYISPFVNAEEMEYLVIEDNFKNERFLLDKASVIFTTKDVVDKVEAMKVCTCLNPLHTFLAIFGALLNYPRIYDAVNDPILNKMIKILGFEEGMKVVINPKIINPKEFLTTVINVRLNNPFIPDSPFRILTDTSMKLPIRFGNTISGYLNDPKLNLFNLKIVPLAFAGWIRYLIGVNDYLTPYDISPDPKLDYLKEVLKSIKIGDKITSDDIFDLLINKTIFGHDLIKINMADRVVEYFNMLNEKKFSVRETLSKIIKEFDL